MKVLGIVAEYNPMHNGHLYHIEQAKLETGADAVVVAMSGDYVQRGEPAFLDKWKRAEIAIRNGIDAVFEIPTFACLGDASIYASAAVKMLEAIGVVDVISFGSETGSLEVLSKVSQRLGIAEIKERTHELSLAGNSYPRARQLAYKAIYKDDIGLKTLQNANDILALEYIRNIKKCEIHTIKREAARYSEGFSNNLRFQSATGIREASMKKMDFAQYVPVETLEAVKNINFETIKAGLFNLVRYEILNNDGDAIDSAPQGGEGLGNLLRKNLYRANDFNDLVLLTKSKRYTYTRISRLLMQLLLHINRNDFNKSDTLSPGYLRILAANSNGRKLIKQAKNGNLNELPFITNINKEKNTLNKMGLKQLYLDIKAADTYNILAKNDMYIESDYVKVPVML